jgi:uncharacterized membrane protein
MTAFTVWTFDNPDGAARSVTALRAAEADGIVKLVDHAVVSWPQGAARPVTEQGHEDRWHSTGWGAFWGVLLGTLFLMPVAGALAGAGLGALSGAMKGVGIGKEQIEEIRSQVTEGTSALFVVTEEADLDRLGERFHGWEGKLVTTNLTAEERNLLHETFGESVPTRPTPS